MPLNEFLRARTQAVANSVASHRLFFYSILSVLAVVLAIGNALRYHSNFFSVAIYLSRSSRSLLVFANFGMILALLAGRVVQAIFFGELRAAEVERLHDRAWYFVTESLLAFTIFRDDFDVGFVMMFGFLLFIKSFHWLASDRIEWMDQRPYPGPPLNFHIRMIVLFLILWTVDFIMFMVAVDSTLEHGVGGMVLFASEYAILTASIWNTVAKYLLTAYELRRAGQRGGESAPPWENKSMWIFYVELITDFLKLTTYMTFFLIIMMFYGLPINIIRDVFMTAKSFYTRLRALHRYQAATRNMDQRYPTATPEEMVAMSDHTCIICREEMALPQADAPRTDGPNTTPKKLPCGHIFHFYCLKSWLERQQSCPTCRRSVLENEPTNQGQQNGVAAPQAQQRPGQANAAEPRRPGGFLQAFMPPARRGHDNHNTGTNPGPSQQGAAAPNRPPQAGEHMPVLIRQPDGGLVIQYRIPPVDQGNNVPQQAAAPPPAQAVPPAFPGLFGGAGGFHGAALNGDAQQPPHPSSPSELINSSRNRNHLSNGSAASNGDATSVASQAASEPTEDVPDTASPEAPTPREAARQAALRRFASSNSSSSSIKRSQPAPTPTIQSNSDSAASPTVSPESTDPPAPASPSTSTPTPAPPSEAAEDLIRPRYADELPRLIPLYDWGKIPPFGPPQATAPPLAQAHLGGFGLPSLSTSSSSSSHLPLDQLPPALTQEQLDRMDRVTRESIDERLKVLEGVSGAVNRCIDELMRVRSSLPPLGLPTPPRQTPAPAESSSDQTGDSTEATEPSST